MADAMAYGPSRWTITDITFFRTPESQDDVPF